MSHADFFVPNHKKMETLTKEKADEKHYVPEATPNWEINLLQELTGLTAEQILNKDLQTLIQLNRIIMFYSCL
jgi:hypothetical protein